MAEYHFTSTSHPLNFISDDGKIGLEEDMLRSMNINQNDRRHSLDFKSSVIFNKRKKQRTMIESGLSGLRMNNPRRPSNTRNVYPVEGMMRIDDASMRYTRGLCSQDMSKYYWTENNGRTSRNQWDEDERNIIIMQGEEILQETTNISEIQNEEIKNLFFYDPDIDGDITIYIHDSDDIEQITHSQIHVIGPYSVFDRDNLISQGNIYQSTSCSHLEGVFLRGLRTYPSSTHTSYGRLAFDRIDNNINKLLHGDEIPEIEKEKIILFLKYFNKSRRYRMDGIDGPNFYTTSRTKPTFQHRYGVNLTSNYEVTNDYPLLINQLYDNAGFIAISANRTSELGYPQLIGSSTLDKVDVPNHFNINRSTSVIGTILCNYYDDNRLDEQLISEAISDINKIRLFNVKTEKGNVSVLNYSIIDAILRHYQTCFCMNWCEEMDGIFNPNTRLGASIMLGLFAGCCH